MTIAPQDLNILRSLAGELASLSNQDSMKEKLDRYYRLNDLEMVRPILLINEIPWGEIKDDFLKPRCSQEFQAMEVGLRRTLFQANHFPVDMVVPPQFNVGKISHNTGIGLEVKEDSLNSTTGSSIQSHSYEDQLETESDLAKLRIPEITYDEERTISKLELARQVFDGLMDVRLSGSYPSYNIWDVVSRFRGVESILMDLAMRPEFMHQTAQKFSEIAEAIISQQESLGLLDGDILHVHTTVAASRHLPKPKESETVKRQHTWGRCAAQIFGDVSPDMHDEFDLTYNQKLFGECAHLYYGCCEPLDRKIDILAERFPNLRKVSITPWANPENGAKNLGSRFVMAAKPNPANVAMPKFNPELVKEEIARYCKTCQENKTPLEFVLKDISTISNNPENLVQWSEVASRTIDEYYG
jgi:hypothetical protein